MGFRFRRSIKILPGVRVNIGKKGVSSVSVGKKGATITTGKTGTHLNVGMPGTGISYRTKINGASVQPKSTVSSSKNASNNTPPEIATFLVCAFLGFMSFFWIKDYMLTLFAFLVSGAIAIVSGFIGMILFIVFDTKGKA